MSKVMNVNSSLAYEILIYLNSFYLGMFFVCEVAMGILKACNANYPENALMTEAGIFGLLCLVEVLRIFLGRRGNLVNRSKFIQLLYLACKLGLPYILLTKFYFWLQFKYLLISFALKVYFIMHSCNQFQSSTRKPNMKSFGIRILIILFFFFRGTSFLLHSSYNSFRNRCLLLSNLSDLHPTSRIYLVFSDVDFPSIGTRFRYSFHLYGV